MRLLKFCGYMLKLWAVKALNKIAPHEHPCPDCDGDGSLDDEEHRTHGCPRDR